MTELKETCEIFLSMVLSITDEDWSAQTKLHKIREFLNEEHIWDAIK